MPEPNRFFQAEMSRVSTLELYAEALSEVPAATADLAGEAWKNPGHTAKHAMTTVGLSAVMGSALGYILPAKGPAALIAGAAMTVPLVYGGIKKLVAAADAANEPGSDHKYIARQLARDTVSGAAEITLSFAGGIAGAEGGYALAASRGRMGSFSQTAQRGIMSAENQMLSAVKNSALIGRMGKPRINPKLPTGKIQTAETAEATTGLVTEKTVPLLEQLPWYRRDIERLTRRADDFDAGQSPIARRLGTSDEYTLVEGSLHIHTKYSDGIGTVKTLGQKAKDGGQQVILFSDHNHLAARGGIKPGDPRIPEQDGIPNIAEAPKWYSEQFAQAADLTEAGKFVALVGTEMGTIGRTGTGGHHGGKNHFIMIEMPQFFEAVRRPRTLFETLSNPFRRMFGMKEIPEVKPPEVIKYNDGDMRGLLTHIRSNGLKDTTGNDPIFIMAHPRWAQDHAPGLPKGTKGADYGRYSYRTKKEWIAETDQHFRMIEVIKGQAMNPNPVPEVGMKDIDLLSFRGYLNEGFHVSPTVGRDAHFGNPLGNPAETGILVSRVDKSGVMEAMRQRRTMATTSMDRLKGSVEANDRYQMGSIIDQAISPDLKLTTRIDSKIAPDAQYTFKLWGDTKVGDRTLADVVQQTTMTGDDLISAGSRFSFDKVRQTIGDKGAYFVEVVRKDPVSGHNDHMYLAPFWIEPISGGGRHSLWMRLLAGSAGDAAAPSIIGS